MKISVAKYTLKRGLGIGDWGLGRNYGTALSGV